MRFGIGGMLAGSLVVSTAARAQSNHVPLGLLTAESSSSQVMHIAACPAPARATFSVETVHEPVVVATDFSLSEIMQLAMQAGWDGDYTPLGFSVGVPQYELVSNTASGNKASCDDPINISIRLTITNRRIEIGKQLAYEPSCFLMARQHYILHATENDIILAQFVKRLRPVLSQLTLPILQHDEAHPEEDRKRVEQLINTAMDRVWPSLKEAMRAASKVVESQDGFASVAKACLPVGSSIFSPEIETKL